MLEDVERLQATPCQVNRRADGFRMRYLNLELVMLEDAARLEATPSPVIYVEK